MLLLQNNGHWFALLSQESRVVCQLKTGNIFYYRPYSYQLCNVSRVLCLHGGLKLETLYYRPYSYRLCNVSFGFQKVLYAF